MNIQICVKSFIFLTKNMVEYTTRELIKARYYILLHITANAQKIIGGLSRCLQRILE